jgi:hypothetical protein
LDPNAGSIHGVGDVDRDGDLDLVCFEGDQLVVYLNDGHGHFTKKPNAILRWDKISAKPRPISGGAALIDFDNDGIPDIVMSGRYYLYLLHGTGGGNFTYVNDIWGVNGGRSGVDDFSLAFGDIDSDGDLDLLHYRRIRLPSGELRAQIAVWRNDLPKQHWLRVRPVGLKGNRSAAGSKIRIYEPGGMDNPEKLLWFEQVAIWGRQSFHSYYAAARTERHFGLGDRTAVDVSVEFYPSGKKVQKKNVNADTTVEVEEK